jgi:hypothetical protein
VGVVASKLNAIKVALAAKDIPQNVNFAIKAGTVVNFLDSNRVSYSTNASTTPMQPADLADLARSMSGHVVCKPPATQARSRSPARLNLIPSVKAIRLA